MKTLNEYFLNNTDKTLYHYTSIKSLLGIAESHSIWASNIYYLNDSNEIIEACNVIQRIITTDIAKHPPNIQDLLNQFNIWLKNFILQPNYIFIFSLSTEKNLLSQWRSYTPHGKGVSLGFSAECINGIISNGHFNLVECLYEESDKKALMHGMINKLLESFGQRHSESFQGAQGQHFYSFFEEFKEDILKTLAIIKHSAFSEEKEWRIISPYFPSYTIPEIKFRKGSSILIPYIEISIKQDFPIEHVMLGPTEHTNLSMSSVSCFLSNKNLCKNVSSSTIPYREW